MTLIGTAAAELPARDSITVPRSRWQVRANNRDPCGEVNAATLAVPSPAYDHVPGESGVSRQSVAAMVCRGGDGEAGAGAAVRIGAGPALAAGLGAGRDGTTRSALHAEMIASATISVTSRLICIGKV